MRFLDTKAPLTLMVTATPEDEACCFTVRLAAWLAARADCLAGGVWVAVLLLGAGGCAVTIPSGDTGLRVSVTAPIRIPAGRAHAIFQRGRLASASSKLNPYCELEVRTVSPAEGARIDSGEFVVSRINSRILVDPTTRISAVMMMSSCSDPLFQESIWWLRSTAPSDVIYLRCIAPYYNCAFGPPLQPPQVQQQVGRYLAVRLATEPNVSPNAHPQ
ncbi:hypothetical protein [Thiorhodovibrio frisius]|uniref:hypothetical protein n=1 Tax=Thiorhodovibrio frisius TaxID=631362 RepID=UPI00030DEB49|nr:hypothetical protein [Thiorhodovibrio frisius]